MAASEISSPKPRWHRILGVLGLVLLVAELAARLFTYVWAERPYRSLAKYRWSPYGLVRNNPDLTMPGYHINANGFRNMRDFQRPKPPRTLRVLTMGGSVLYAGLATVMIRNAERVDSDATIAQFLENELRADPALAGLNVEVLNAAVNFNRINEISTAYLAELAQWDPDLVLVFGSANNFPAIVKRSDLEASRYGVGGDHPWSLEFHRVANGRDLFAAMEHIQLFAEQHLASVAWTRRLSERALDNLFQRSAQRMHRGAPRRARDADLPTVEQVDAYTDAYLAYAEALVAGAKRRGQTVAFFWEYFLKHLKGEKPLSEDEAELYGRLELTDRPDGVFAFRARDRVRQQLAAAGVKLLDPLEALRAEPRTVFIDYLHYTAYGNQVMARFCYEQLKDEIHRRAAALR